MGLDLIFACCLDSDDNKEEVFIGSLKIDFQALLFKFLNSSQTYEALTENRTTPILLEEGGMLGVLDVTVGLS
jgi:hypothetical protein